MTYRSLCCLTLGGLALLTAAEDVAGLPWMHGQIQVGRQTSAADSITYLSVARDAQQRFELIRIRYAPMTRQWFGSHCDEQVGRMCLRFGGPDVDEWDPVPEDDRVQTARLELIEVLEAVAREIPGDAWVLGQRVAYLGEADAWTEAVAATAPCPLAAEDQWWCDALQGKALHHLGRFSEADSVFIEALQWMRDETREAWRDLSWVLEPELRAQFEGVEGDSIARLEARFWSLADPLYLVHGNDRRTAHYSRHTLAEIRSNSRNPYGLVWRDDLTEVLVRYGPKVEYEMATPTLLHQGFPSVVGRFDPRSRGFLPTAEQFLEPEGIAPGAWRTEERRSRARHAPSYAPRIGSLETQVARFRRGTDLVVVLGWKTDDWEVPSEADLTSGLFFRSGPELAELIPETRTSGPVLEQGHARGAALARVPSGSHLLSMEVLDADGARAWRARYGVNQEPVQRGVVILSDPVLFEPSDEDGADLPTEQEGREQESDDVLELHLSRVLPGTRLPSRTVELGWEVYGLVGDEGQLRFRISAAPEEQGILRRAARLLRLVRAPRPLEVTWEEAPPPTPIDESGPALFRRVTLDLSSMAGGATRLVVGLSLPGRTETTSEVLVDLLD